MLNSDSSGLFEKVPIKNRKKKGGTLSKFAPKNAKAESLLEEVKAG